VAALVRAAQTREAPSPSDQYTMLGNHRAIGDDGLRRKLCKFRERLGCREMPNAALRGCPGDEQAFGISTRSFRIEHHRPRRTRRLEFSPFSLAPHLRLTPRHARALRLRGFCSPEPCVPRLRFISLYLRNTLRSVT
jgi:hypothetical protein